MDPVPAELLTAPELPFDLTLKKVTFGPTGSIDSDDLSSLAHVWVDYQPNSLAWPVVSARLREVIDQQASGFEHHEWVPVNVHGCGEASRTYYLLRFQNPNDVLDYRKSTFHRPVGKPERLAKPIFVQEKIAPLCVFAGDPQQWQITSHLFVSQAVRAAATRAGLVGLHYEPSRVG
jgi:hypothetical protein